jgi:hypothetical protein
VSVRFKKGQVNFLVYETTKRQRFLAIAEKAYFAKASRTKEKKSLSTLTLGLIKSESWFAGGVFD